MERKRPARGRGRTPGGGLVRPWILTVFALLLALGPQASGVRGQGAGDAVPAEPAGGSQELRRIFDRTFDRYLELDPVLATSVGENRYNHRLTLDLLPAEREKRRTLFAGARAELARVDRGELSDRDLLYADAFDEWLAVSLEGLEVPGHLLPFRPGNSLPTRFPQMGSGQGLHPFRTVDDYDDFLGRIRDFERWVGAAIANMRRGIEVGVVQPRSIVEKALPELASFAAGEVEDSVFYRPVKNLPEGIPAAERQRLTAAYRQAIAGRVMPAYARLVGFLRREYLPACRETISLSALPQGERWYRLLVRFFTTTEMTPEEIYALGLSEVERIEGEMDRLRRELRLVGIRTSGSRRDFRRAMASNPESYHTRPRAVFAGFAAIRKRVERALPRLFGRRPAATFEVRPVEPYRALSSPGAFYEGPSADGSRPGTFYVNIRGRYYPKNTMEALFLHEALPGHHFQIALARERDDLPRFLRYGYFGALTEGWGLYCEGLGRDLGLYRDPFQRYGRLVYDLGRASRLVADVGIHHLGWTRKEALGQLSRRQLGWAINELDRYVEMPAQALSYKVGEQQILALRRRAEETLGERFDIRRFHDAVLADGPLPLALLRRKIEHWIAGEG
jgi:uncharacterized protein (DUF885 family)